MDHVNSFLINTTEVQSAVSVLSEIIDGKHDLVAMRRAAITTASRFSIEQSSAATAVIFREFHQQWKLSRRMKYGMRRKYSNTALPGASASALQRQTAELARLVGSTQKKL